MSASQARAQRFIGPALLAAACAALLVWTWRAWPDPLVDFGRELYVPWRITEGDVLFRDIAWFNGPLSPYVNALWFQLFGTGLMTLALANLAILGGTLFLAYRIVARSAGRFAAATGGLLFLSMFAFAQLAGIANYNWLAPYSHEATHGLALALGTLAALDAWRSSGKSAWLAAGGLALGLCFLTKPETFLGALAAAVVLLAGARSRTVLSSFALPALVPPLVAMLLLALALPPEAALRGVLGAWPSIFDGRVAELAFYQAGMGLDDPARRAAELLRWSGWWLAAFAPAAILAWLWRADASRRRRELAVAAALALATLAALWLVRERVPWLSAALPLPLVALAAGGWLLVRAWRGGEPERVGLALAVLALALLSKMILNARIAHYGFTLALPATLLTAALVMDWIPASLGHRGRSALIFRSGAASVLSFVAAMHVSETGAWLGRKTEVVGEGRDAFRADLRGRFVNEALRAIEKSGAATLVVLPEGVTLNYLARIPNPTPYVNFMPPEMILFGEEAWLAALRAKPPDLVFLVHKDTSEYGYPFFGADYGTSVADWLRAEYRPIGLLGDEPLVPGTLFGMRLFARGREP